MPIPTRLVPLFLAWVLAGGAACSALPGGTCEPRSCGDVGAECGTVASDGCGNSLDCGACSGAGVCGFTEANRCCVPRACTPGVSCGLMDDGCGGTVACGDCTSPQTCGGGGQDNVCGCMPRNDCAAAGATCGELPDGCGGMTVCGMCTSPQTCGGGGQAGTCGCTPVASCAAAGASCGTLDNGCGGTLTCTGTCTMPETCGGGGTPNTCGCTPITCEGVGAECGSIPDGCGGTLECGGCTLPETCGGGGRDLLCGCTPRACPAGLTCGQVPDGCGGLAICGTGGTCSGNDVCGGGGVDNVCAPVTPFLANVHPRVVAPGSTLFLEGSFVAPVNVGFEGGVTATAEVLGLRRARVVVPAAARSGGVTVTQGGTTSPPFDIRVARTALALQPLDVLAAQGGAMPMQSARLLVPRDHHQSVVVGRYVYVLGGRGAQGAVQGVERAMVHEDGTVGPFMDAGVALTTARERFGALVLGGHVYVVGGSGPQGLLRSVERAPINADGTLGGFQVLGGVELAAGRRDFGVEVVGSYLHVLGGAGADGPVAVTERATIGPDGVPGTFVVTGSPLVTPRTTHRTVVAGDALYVLGGLDGMGNALGSVEKAAIQPDGSLGAFTVDTVALGTPRFDLAAVVVDQALYVLGGRGAGGPLASVELAGVSPSGLTAFEATGTGLHVARHGHVAVTAGGMMVITGGKDATAQRAEVETAPLVLDGSLEAFANVQGVALQTPRHRHASAVIGNRVYIIGGSDAADATLATVEVATLDADGVPGPFTVVPGVTLVTPRRGAVALRAAGRLYVVAGENGNTALQNVEVSTLSADGVPGPFTVVPNISLNTARTDFAAVATPRGLFVVGGRNGNTYLQSVERTPVNANGALGPFENVATAALPTPRAGGTAMVAGNTVHLLGGMSAANTLLGSALVSTLAANGDLGPWMENGTLATPRRHPRLVRSGSYALIIGGSDGTLGIGSLERAAYAANGTLGPWGTYPGIQLVTPREAMTAFAAGNHVVVVGGRSTVALGNAERARVP